MLVACHGMTFSDRPLWQQLACTELPMVPVKEVQGLTLVDPAELLAGALLEAAAAAVA